MWGREGRKEGERDLSPDASRRMLSSCFENKWLLQSRPSQNNDSILYQ